jgi:hypothetical protein
MQYRNDDDLFFGYIVKDAKVPDAQTVSRRLSSAQPLDTAPTRTVGLVPQVGLHRIEDRDRIYTPRRRRRICLTASGRTTMRNMT